MRVIPLIRTVQWSSEMRSPCMLRLAVPQVLTSNPLRAVQPLSAGSNGAKPSPNSATPAGRLIVRVQIGSRGKIS